VSEVVGILPAMNEVRDVGRTVVLLGVPSSAGAHHAGQDLAPAALRRGGFGDRLAAADVNVEDRGDIAGEVFAVDHSNPTQRNLARSRWAFSAGYSEPTRPRAFSTSMATPI
jgi:arginase family enzyme